MLNLFEDQDLRETLQFVEEKVHAGLWSWDLGSGQLKWSDGHYSLFGIDVLAVKMTFERQLSMVHPEDRYSLQELEAMLGQGLPFTREFRIIQPTGRMRWLEMRGEALLDGHGKACRAVGLTFDITDQREAQQSAFRDARFRKLIGGVVPLVWSATPDGREIELVSASETGNTSIEAGDRGWLDAVHPDDMLLTLETWNLAVTSRSFFETEHRLRNRDGAYRLFHTSGVPRHGTGGGFLGWQGVCVDLTARQRCNGAKAANHAITGAQVRAARGILKWSVSDLATAANVSPAIIRRIEDFDGTSSRSDTATDMLRKALIDGGVEFLFPVDGRPGVRPAPSNSEMHRPTGMVVNARVLRPA